MKKKGIKKSNPVARCEKENNGNVRLETMTLIANNTVFLNSFFRCMDEAVLGWPVERVGGQTADNSRKEVPSRYNVPFLSSTFCLKDVFTLNFPLSLLSPPGEWRALQHQALSLSG